MNTFIPFGPYPGAYLHAINLNDWYPCANIANTGGFPSAEFARVAELIRTQSTVFQPGYREIDLDAPEPGIGCAFPSRRAISSIHFAPFIRAGGKLGIGIENTVWFDEDQYTRILRFDELEKAFEKRRRSIAPNSASRLGCIWVADDSAEGCAMLNKIFEGAYILKVEIVAALRVTRADSRWVDAYAYEKSKNQIHIDAYWNGEKFPDEGESWEYLVEGRIGATDETQVQYVREHGCPPELILKKGS